MFVWLTFFDSANLIEQYKLWRECVHLEEQTVYYDKEYDSVLEDKERLLGSAAAVETFGREKYFMKKEGETVFILVDEDEKLLEEK